MWFRQSLILSSSLKKTKRGVCSQGPHTIRGNAHLWPIPTLHPRGLSMTSTHSLHNTKIIVHFLFYPSRLYLFTNRICHSLNDIFSVWRIVVWNFYACYVLYSSLFHHQRWNGTSVNLPVLDRGMYLARNFYLIVISQREIDFKCLKNCEWHCNWSQFVLFFFMIFLLYIRPVPNTNSKVFFVEIWNMRPGAHNPEWATLILCRRMCRLILRHFLRPVYF